jgi:hypothetical protein
MAHWLDRVAKRAASATPEQTAASARDSRDDTPVPLSSSARSRRDFMKKAAVVGGLAWSVPVIQSVVVPAAAASGQTQIGDPCTNYGGLCGDSSVCFNGVCGSPGASCANANPCFNSACSGKTQTCGGQLAYCTDDSQCASGNCNTHSHKCAKK